MEIDITSEKQGNNSKNYWEKIEFIGKEEYVEICESRNEYPSQSEFENILKISFIPLFGIHK